MNHTTICFDANLAGFGRWCSNRLRKLGYRVIILVPSGIGKWDMLVKRYAKKNRAILVTTDKTIGYEPKIVLPMSKPKYETWYTILIKKLHEIEN